MAANPICQARVVLGHKDEILKIRCDMGTNLGGAMSPFNAWLMLRGRTWRGAIGLLAYSILKKKQR